MERPNDSREPSREDAAPACAEGPAIDRDCDCLVEVVSVPAASDTDLTPHPKRGPLPISVAVVLVRLAEPAALLPAVR
jgi:hypothetical protein